MKAIKIRPSQRQLLVVLSMTILTGCSAGIQPKAVYKNLEKSVQHVYEAAAPIHKEGLVPALFRTVSAPGMDALRRSRIVRARHQTSSSIPVAKELNPVKQHTEMLKNVKHVKHIDGPKHVEQIKHIKRPKLVKPSKSQDYKKTERTTPIKNLQYIEKYYGL